MNAELHSFPKLTTLEIIKCLNELGAPVTKEDLSNPTRELVTNLFEFLTEICLGANREDFSQPAFAGLQAINYPELHDESIPHINSLRNIFRMMDICQVFDFSIRDLITPSRNRLVRQLSGIMNFAKFREGRLILLSELNAIRQEVQDTLKKTTEKHEIIANRLNLLKQQTKEEDEMIQQFERDCNSFESSIKDSKSNIDLLDQHTLDLTADVTKQQTRLDEQTIHYQDLISDQKYLSTQIVSSPQKFRNQILEIGQILQHEQKDGKIAEKKIRELSAWIQNVDEAQGEVKIAFENLKEIQCEVDKQKGMIVELDCEKQLTTGLRNDLLQQQQNSQQLERRIKRQEEKLMSLRAQTGISGEEKVHTMQELHHQLMEAESYRVQVK